MVYIVIESWYPAAKAVEVGKLYLEVMKKYPDDRSIGKPIVQSAVNSEREGIHVIHISEIKPGKIREALDMASNRMIMLASIEGFKYTQRLYYTIVEAMPFIGLQAPE
ncbi:MAG: hypothetical protein ACFFBP_17055 [Promethearchaeota archaeon]